MALYENKITLKGYLGKDAENFSTKQGKTFTTLSLATKSGYKDKQTGQWVNHTEWHRIVAFGKVAEYARNLSKGAYVEVEGELRSTERDAEVVKDKKKIKTKLRGWEIRASLVRKLADSQSSREENLDAGVPADRSSSVGWDSEPVSEEDAA